MLDERDTVTRGNVLRIDRDGRISKVTEAQNMTTYSSTESADRFRLMTNAPPKDLATLQEQVKRMKEQAAVAAQRARDDVQASKLQRQDESEVKALEDENLALSMQKCDGSKNFTIAKMSWNQ